GPAVYGTIWRPLLEGKFGPYADEVNMAWLWARLKARSFKLGYFEGGFQAFCDALLAAARARGASVHLGASIAALEPADGGGWRLTASGAHGAGVSEHDAVIVT